MDSIISVVVPVFGGDSSLNKIFERLIEVNSELDSYDLELVLVFDNGRMESWQTIKSILGRSEIPVKAIRLGRNYGQHNALICGFENSKGIFAFSIDDDFQQDPIELVTLLEKQKENDYDVVYGKYPRTKHGIIRNLLSRILNGLLKVGLPELHKDYSPVRLIKRSIYIQLPQMRSSYSFLDGYISWLTDHIISVEIKHLARDHGKSSYNFRKLVAHSVNIFITFSRIPIRIMTLLSGISFLSTLIFTMVVLWKRIFNQIDVPGYTSTIVLLGLGFGFIFLSLGILGEYIYRINYKTTLRPNYSIREIKSNTTE